MPYVMDIQRGEKIHSVIISAEELCEVQKDPTLIGKYWEKAEIAEKSIEGMSKRKVEIEKGHKRPVWDLPACEKLLGHIKQATTPCHMKILKGERIMWEQISQKMNVHSHEYSPEDCENQWNNIVLTSKEVEDEKGCGFVTVGDCKLYSLLIEIENNFKLMKKPLKNISLSGMHTKNNVNTLEIECIDLEPDLVKDCPSSSTSSPNLHEHQDSVPPLWFKDFEENIDSKFKDMENTISKEVLHGKSIVREFKVLEMIL